MRIHRAFLTSLSVLMLAACAAPGPSLESPSPQPSEPAAPSEAAPSEAAPSVAGSPGELEDGASCENPDFGYTVRYPADWWANEAIQPEDPVLTPIPACQYFARAAVDLQPNAGLPGGLAVWFELEAADPPIQGTITDEAEVTVAGTAASRIEYEPEPQPGFVPEGARITIYVVPLAEGFLTATTDTFHQDAALYPESQEVLDAMMGTLTLDDLSEG